MTSKIQLSLGTKNHTAIINRIRHEVYATELGQFEPNSKKTIHDRPEVDSTYIIAYNRGMLVGFVAITPPSSPSFSMDKYIERSASSLQCNGQLYEVRALTIVDSARGSRTAPALMYAAFRWIQDQGGTQLAAIGHQKVRDMYIRLGMQPEGKTFRCGNLEYELLSAPISLIEKQLIRFRSRLNRLEQQIEWQLPTPFRSAATECYHGGAFFEAIGNTFDDLSRRNEIINADVLDAWFPPCPEAQQALQKQLGWIMRTSPPNHAEGLKQILAETRGIQPENILLGGGSSPLIFLAFRHWLTSKSKVLILNPMYGEYAHVLENVVGCNVERFTLHRENQYAVDTDHLATKLKEGFDLVVWVNPNSPTGRHVDREQVESTLKQLPTTTRVWIDETYIEYAGENQTLETFAAKHDNIVVVKSMSKVYGLSGLRVGYLCGSTRTLEPLRRLIPPWSISLPAQIAAIKALQHPEYYISRYDETHYLRAKIMYTLREIGISEIIPGTANFVLIHLPDNGPDGKTVINRCRKKGLFIRDAAEMGTDMGDRAIRIAVKDAGTNTRMLSILKHAISEPKEKRP